MIVFPSTVSVIGLVWMVLVVAALIKVVQSNKKSVLWKAFWLVFIIAFPGVGLLTWFFFSKTK